MELEDIQLWFISIKDKKLTIMDKELKILWSTGLKKESAIQSKQSQLNNTKNWKMMIMIKYA